MLAIDGIKIFGNNKKNCKKCLTTNVKGNNHYYHSGDSYTAGEKIKAFFLYDKLGYHKRYF